MCWMKNFRPASSTAFDRSITQRRIVRVAAHRRDRRDPFQLLQNPRQPDVTRVQNVVHPRKPFQDFRVQKIMRVRDDANLHKVTSDL